MPLLGARHGPAGPAAGTLPCHPTERWLRTRVLSAVCLFRVLPRRQEGSTRCRESWFSERIPSRSAIAISAGGGKSAPGSGVAMIIFHLLPGLPDCNARN